MTGAHRRTDESRAVIRFTLNGRAMEAGPQAGMSLLGLPVSLALKDQGLLRAPAMPPVDVIFVEETQPEGPYGAKGVGEAAAVPTAAAAAAALHAYDGIRRTRLPMRDSPAALGLLPGRRTEAG